MLRGAGSSSFLLMWPWWFPCWFVTSVLHLVYSLVGHVRIRGCILQAEEFWVTSGVLEIFHRQIGQLPPLFLLLGICVGCRRCILGLLNSEKGFKLSLSSGTHPASWNISWCLYFQMFSSQSSMEQLQQFRDGQQDAEIASMLTWLTESKVLVLPLHQMEQTSALLLNLWS